MTTPDLSDADLSEQVDESLNVQPPEGLDETPAPEAPPLPAVAHFAVYEKTTGRVMRAGYVIDEASALLQAQPGEAVYLGAVPPQNYIGADGPVALGDAPSDDYAYDWASHAWQLRDLEDLRATARVRVDTAYSEATTAISAGYPLEERESWPVQTSEARALMADPDAVTPWIAAAAQARGLTQIDLAQRIIVLDDAYRAVHGTLSGTRQQLQRRISAATTHEELKAVAWPASLQGTS